MLAGGCGALTLTGELSPSETAALAVWSYSKPSENSQDFRGHLPVDKLSHAFCASVSSPVIWGRPPSLPTVLLGH